MWNKTTYPFLVQALCIIPLKSIRMWASFIIFVYSKKNFFYLKIRTIVLITIVDYPLDLRVGHKKGKQLNTNHFPFIKSGYQDSNLGPPAPKAGALTGLRYTPSCNS